MNILIVDDDSLVCESLELLLSRETDLQVLGTAANGVEAVTFCETHDVQIVLMDIQMPIMNGIEATKKLKSIKPELVIMMLTTFHDEQNIRLALAAGAKGYLIKSMDVTQMAHSIRSLASGSSVLDPRVIETLLSPKEKVLAELTEREQSISHLIAKGLSNKEIASQLFLSEGTVRNNLSIILGKLELRDRTQLAIYYLQSEAD
ncbi:response regulator [Alkalicoccobacillus porphyridii]|uniref:Response regulator transcription factor n=1 Tax=Alkalicoccobacillus porphyridii TaxID=2597270 RepID=A0A553ZV17_9BACI|nr:response regulator transcription factor [Alkalicoccobacillus porphyridii]TSB45331.1 response regulator transcription factor [Alkalicoccobacillus porphyridii]